MPKRSSDRPQQRYTTGEPGKIHGRDSVGIVEASCGYRDRGVSIRGKFVLSKAWVQDEGVAICLNVNSTPPAAVRHGRAGQMSGTGPCWDCRRVLLVTGPRDKYSGKILTPSSGMPRECQALLPPLPSGRSVFAENSFYRAPGGKWAQETCAGCPQQRSTTGEPVKVHGRDRVGIVEWFCGYRARGVSIRG